MPNCIYAIIYAYYKEDEYTSNPDIYQIVLHDLIPSRHPTIDIEPSCTPIYVSIYDNRKKSLFDASMNAAANQLEFFEFKNENGILNQFIILEVKQLDQALVAKYKSPIHINFGRKKPVITFYLRSNKCFREKHHCTPCRARINPKEKYRDFTDPIVIDIIRCDRCEKYFVTKEMFASKGGAWCYYIQSEYDPSIQESDKHDIRFGYHYSAMQETFDNFSQHSDINSDGYSTQKPATVRQALLKQFMDTDRHSAAEIIQYLHEKYLDTGWHGENATERARDDLYFVLNYMKKDKIINASLDRP